MTTRNTIIIAHRTEEYQATKAIRGQDHYPFDDPNDIENSDNYYEADEWESEPYTGAHNYNPNKLRGETPIRSWKRLNGVWVQQD